MRALDAAALRSLPKVELHCHVDGSARPGTLLELARAGGHALPAGVHSAADLAPHVRVSPACRSLDGFLHTFETFYPWLAAPGAMGRLARELVQDAAADGVVHLEARFCPALQAHERAGGGRFSAEDVLKETLAGLADAARATGCSTGALVCLYRPLPRDVNAGLLELALRWHGRGVVGIDLAGPEHLPGAPLAPLFARAHAAGLPATVHAGEAAGPESVREALDLLHAVRLGHGVAVARDSALVARVRDAGVALECCLTSNLQTGAVTGSVADHPFDALRRAGVAVTLNTDDPGVSGITLGGELALAASTWGLHRDDLAALQLRAAEAAFLPGGARAALRQRLATD
jgi:adenosine deaminase